MNYSITKGVYALLGSAVLFACAVDTAQTETAAVSAAALTECPGVSGNDDQERAAATVAFQLMKLAAASVASSANTMPATTILAPQRYRKITTAVGIEFDPSDPLYSYVTNAMKAELAFAQLDSSEALYLAEGLQRSFDVTDGQVYPSIFATPALAGFKLGRSVTTHLQDSASADNSHYATVSGQPWCGTVSITLSETVNKDSAFAPLVFRSISDWRTTVPAAFYGAGIYAHEPSTPFNGVSGQNPYLLVSINGVAQRWAFETMAIKNCFNNAAPNHTCSAALEIDPVPYAEPGAYYDANNALVGPQPNPFSLTSTTLYADPSHQDQWATRTVNGVQEWGTFSKSVTLYGQTKYMYVRQV